MSGIITLALLAVLLVFIVKRITGKLGIKTSRNTNVGIVVVFVLVILMLWGQSIQS